MEPPSTSGGHNRQHYYTMDSDFLRPAQLAQQTAGQEPAVMTCLVLLNFDLPRATASIWQQASLAVCADGGANRLYDCLPSMLSVNETEAATARLKFLPHAVIGDLDSIRPEVRSYYMQHDVKVLDQSADQDTTDLVKCLLYLEDEFLRRRGGTDTKAVTAAPMDAAETSSGGGAAALHRNGADAPGATTPSTVQAQVGGGESIQLDMAAASSAAREAAAAAAAAAEAATAAASTQDVTGAANAAAAAAAAAADAAAASAKAATAAAAAAQAAQSLQDPSPCQSSNQTSSSARASSSCAPDLRPHRIIVMGALGGRLDHALSNLNALYQYPHLNIVLWGGGNIVRLLKSGTTCILPARECEGPSCGLVPLGSPATATSSGLRWNVDKTFMQISGLISTCNKIDADEVWVTTDRELLWMTEVEDT